MEQTYIIYINRSNSDLMHSNGGQHHGAIIVIGRLTPIELVLWKATKPSGSTCIISQRMILVVIHMLESDALRVYAFEIFFFIKYHTYLVK